MVLEDSEDYNRTTVYENDQECSYRKEEVKWVSEWMNEAELYKGIGPTVPRQTTPSESNWKYGAVIGNLVKACNNLYRMI